MKPLCKGFHTLSPPLHVYIPVSPSIVTKPKTNMPSPALPKSPCLQLQRLTISSKQDNHNNKPNNHHPLPLSSTVPEPVSRHHVHDVGPDQCCSAFIQTIAAPVSTVWSVVRRFDNPQVYKHFIRSCQVIFGDGDVGTLREVQVVSGLPAESSTERLEILDDEQHVMSFSVVGGEHRLVNYRSVTTLHPTPNGLGTVVVESYVVDVPTGNTKDETCVFVDTIVRFNLQTLARIAEHSAE